MSDVPSIPEFRALVLDHYRREGRAFPWRETREPWAIMVSEFMLQQTQTERVVPYWKRWLKLWPTPADLAAAPLELVLREWSGLGYNRRARFLREAASAIVADHGGRVPADPEALDALPGIGPYTARAIAAFAFGRPEVFIETNIRAVVLHFFFPGSTEIHDRELLPILSEALDRDDPRSWYYALMDYGAVLKKLTVNPSRRSAHYAKQSPFAGSLRQARGAALRSLAATGPASVLELAARTGIVSERINDALAALASDGMVAERDGVYRIP